MSQYVVNDWITFERVIGRERSFCPTCKQITYGEVIKEICVGLIETVHITLDKSSKNVTYTVRVDDPKEVTVLIIPEEKVIGILEGSCDD